jgi:hypothetical protein
MQKMICLHSLGGSSQEFAQSAFDIFSMWWGATELLVGVENLAVAALQTLDIWPDIS